MFRQSILLDLSHDQNLKQKEDRGVQARIQRHPRTLPLQRQELDHIHLQEFLCLGAIQERQSVDSLLAQHVVETTQGEPMEITPVRSVSAHTPTTSRTIGHVRAVSKVLADIIQDIIMK